MHAYLTERATPYYCGEAAPAGVSQRRPDVSLSACGHPLWTTAQAPATRKFGEEASESM
jgi:hypothetical protein